MSNRELDLIALQYWQKHGLPQVSFALEEGRYNIYHLTSDAFAGTKVCPPCFIKVDVISGEVLMVEDTDESNRLLARAISFAK